MASADRRPWNHNIAYHRAVLDAAPLAADRALDVGCGSGLLLEELAERFAEVVGIDSDETALTVAAHRLASHPNVRLQYADVLSTDLPLVSFDLVTAVAVLHHLPLRVGLARLAALVRPGGRLAVIGLYRASTVADYVTSAVAVPAACLLRRHRGETPLDAPVTQPKDTLAEIRAGARDIIPGAEVRRRLLFRYTLIWTRPLLPSRSGNR